MAAVTGTGKWKVTHHALTKYLPSATWMIVQYCHPIIGHHVVFRFERKGKCLYLLHLWDNFGALYRLSGKQYLPYPQDLYAVISEVYGLRNDGIDYLVYDPPTTLGCYLATMGSSFEALAVIRAKLLHELRATARDDIASAMGTRDIKGWIETNTSCTVELEEDVPPGFIPRTISPIAASYLRPRESERKAYICLEQFVMTEGVEAMLEFLASTPRVINGKYEGTQITAIGYKVSSK